MQNRLSIVTLFIAFFVYTGWAFANDVNLAKQRFQEGVDAFMEENYLGALQSFEDSYRLVPKASVLYNIGMCQKALFKMAEALSTFKKYLKEEGEDISIAKRKTVEAAILEITKMVGVAVISEAPEGADVLLNGKYLGNTPLIDSIVLNPGRHTIRIQKEGLEPLEIEVTAVSGAELTLRAVLEPPKAVLSVKCNKDVAEVMLDGQKKGTCPLEEEISAGTYELIIQSEGMRMFKQQISLVPGERLVVSAALEPEITDDSSLSKQSADYSVTTEPVRHNREVLKVALSVTSLVLGAGLTGIGGYYNHRSAMDERDGEKLSSAMAVKQNKAEYDEMNEDLSTLRTDLNLHKSMMFVGYALGGVLIATGTTLMILKMKNKTKAESTRVSILSGQLNIRF